MKNLNAEQIIKALECCQKRKCQSCTYDVFGNPLSNCRVKKHALSLIKQLTEEVNDLKEDKELYSVFCEDYKGQIKKLTEENERLRAENAQIIKEAVFSPMERANNTLVVRADTVRKMQERLKAQKFTHKNFGELVYVDDIDQIAKEMVEGAGNG